MRSALLFALLLLGCDRRENPPPPPVTSTPTAATSASVAAPAVSSAPAAETASAPTPAASLGLPEPSAKKNLCDTVITLQEIQAACGDGAKAVKVPGGEEFGAPGTSCTRGFTGGDRVLTLMLTKHKDAAEAKELIEGALKSKKEEPEFKAIGGLGDGALRYVSITMTGDLNHTLQARKGATSFKLFTPKITSNNRDLAPICTLDQLEKVAKIVASRLLRGAGAPLPPAPSPSSWRRGRSKEREGEGSERQKA